MCKLSSGALDQIMNGRNIKEPILQLLSYRKLPGATFDWYRLVVSDGLRINQYAMLSTELNRLFENGTLTNYAVFKVSDYKVSSTIDEKQTLIIMGVQVLIPGNDVPDIIGSPTAKVTNKFEPETSKPHSSTVVHHEVEDNMQPSTISRDTNNSSRQEFGVPIITLSPKHRQAIKARVTNKSSIKEWKNKKGKLFSMHLHDNSDEIKCVAFNDKLYNNVENNKVYHISNYELKDSDRRYNKLKNQYEIIITDDTRIKESHDDADIPSIHFDFCPISQVENKQIYDTIDVLGVVVKSNLKTFTKQSNENFKRDIDIVDNSQPSGARICVTLWGQQAQEFDCNNGTILAIKGARVDEFNGKRLTIINSPERSTIIRKDPDLPEARVLLEWYRSYWSKFNCTFRTIRELTEATLGITSNFFKVMAIIDSIHIENCIYKACPKDNCKKKLTELAFEKYRCDSCKRDYLNFKYCLLLNMIISDITGNHRVTAFDEVAEKILEISAQELVRLKENDNNAYIRKIDEAVLKRYTFYLKGIAEVFHGQRRPKYTCISIEPLNHHIYLMYFLQKINELLPN
ncbi:replication protein A 70 kDa DNA-binding subunit isoform X2 [Harpegnathos saltator]|uniref:replication protein A 70 kDa DNA-binding subunit isoform X2 n=1 Tax=Harpegnathos saltator TaxID=610380 RepID=UPI00058CFBDC|nr:replication protein A 70 kDa DNA-binding subunit isoform X2 [Harpegnathos saltator]